MTFTLPNLPYATDHLSPFMSVETLEIHHGKHHLAYVNNLNTLLEGSPLKGLTIIEIIKKSYNKPELSAIFNNASQYYNHVEFWKSMKNNPNPSIPAKVTAALTKEFGSLANFRTEFIKAGTQVFGSGWAWLAKDASGKLEILKTSNGVNPIALDKFDILGVDVWEHSYYIDYRNKRPDYLTAWFDNLVNWEYVGSKL